MQEIDKSSHNSEWLCHIDTSIKKIIKIFGALLKIFTNDHMLLGIPHQRIGMDQCYEYDSIYVREIVAQMKKRSK
jgi:hypothetical protein